MSFLDTIGGNKKDETLNQEPEKMPVGEIIIIIKNMLDKKDLDYSSFFNALDKRLDLDFDGVMDFIDYEIANYHNGKFSIENIEKIINDFENLYRKRILIKKTKAQQALDEALGETSNHFSKMANDIIDGQKKIDEYMSKKELLNKWENSIKKTINFATEQILINKEISKTLNNSLFEINDFLVKNKDMDFIKKEEKSIESLKKALDDLPKVIESIEKEYSRGVFEEWASFSTWEKGGVISKKKDVENLILKIKNKFYPDNSLDFFKESFAKIIKNAEERK